MKSFARFFFTISVSYVLQAKRAVIDPNLSFLRQLEEYETQLGYGSVAESLAHQATVSEVAASPKAKRPCLSLPLNSLLSQAVTPSSFTEEGGLSFVFEASSGPSGGNKSARSSPITGGSPSSALPGCHSPSPLVSQVCHSPLLSPS